MDRGDTGGDGRVETGRVRTLLDTEKKESFSETVHPETKEGSYVTSRPQNWEPRVCPTSVSRLITPTLNPSEDGPSRIFDLRGKVSPEGTRHVRWRRSRVSGTHLNLPVKRSSKKPENNRTRPGNSGGREKTPQRRTGNDAMNLCPLE